MSYYRPSFAQTTGNMSRGGGRGGSFSSSRGSSSYRGRGSNSWNSSSSRGYHGTNSRGGNNGSATYRSSGGYAGGSFDPSRSMGKYSSSTGERISFRTDESYNRKPSYRPDPTYSRDARLSPDRKRMRTESRHDVYSGGESGGMSSRGYLDSGEHRRSSMPDFARTKLPGSSPFGGGGGGGGSHRMSSAGDFRKPLAPPPPPNISGRPYRGGARGMGARPSRYIVSGGGRDTSRTLHRPQQQQQTPQPPRRLMDYSTTWRANRGASSARSADYARRLRLRQLTNRSAIIRSSRPILSSRIKSRNDSDDELWGVARDEDDDEDDEDEEDEDEDDDDNSKEVVKESLKESADDADAEKAEKKVVDDSKGDDDEEDEDEDKRSDSVAKKDAGGEDTPKKKSPVKRVSSTKESRDHDSMDTSSTYRNKFIKLICPYCHTRCITFSRYTMHLRSARHSAAMHHVTLKQKSILSRMRINQRAEQKDVERAADDADLTPRTNFCPLCKLNYRQAKVVHRASKAHRDMKRFLMPTCRTCSVTCKSPMLYETHCCSLEHIKRKAYSGTSGGDKSDKSEHSGDDLQNYMTIDSVGDMDDIDMEIPPPPSVTAVESVKDTASVIESTDGDTKTTVSKVKSDRHSSASVKREREPQINIGVENIRKIDVHYCDLCRMYLPREEDVHDDIDRILAKHCKQRTHMQRYIRYKEDKDLAKRAERLQRREMAEKEKDAKRSAVSATSAAPKDDQIKSTPKNTPTTDAGTVPAATKDESSATLMVDSGLDATVGDDVQVGGEDSAQGVGAKEANDAKEIQEADEAEAGDDKLWEDVDKDLGDILAGENKSCASDEEEEEDDDNSVVNGERYDRFKYSEKSAKAGNVAKNTPIAAKKMESDGGKTQIEGDATK